MRPVLLLALLTACTPDDPATDPSIVTTDTGTPLSETVPETESEPSSEPVTETETEAEPPPLPPRLEARRWRETFADDFVPDASDDCYDNDVTPPLCMDIYWNVTECDEAFHANLADLNKCVWVAYDIYNWMDWGKPLEGGHGINNLHPGEVTVDAGNLWLSATPEPDITWEPGQSWPWDCGNGGTQAEDWYTTIDCPIQSGAIHSNPDYAHEGFDQLYGRFEVRAIIPNDMGAWPAHWMLPTGGGWPADGEIDIMEAVAHDPTAFGGSFHGGLRLDEDTRAHHSKHNHHDPGEPRFAEDWHTYAVEWDPEEIRFFVDDLQIGRVWQGEMLDGTILDDDADYPAFPVDIPSMPFYFLLNTSVVPTGGFSLKDFEALEHRIDFVRAYEPCASDEEDPDCVVRGTGSGNVTDAWSMTGSRWAASGRVLHTGDFDGSGATDLLLQGRSPGTSTLLLLADGLGGFADPVDLTSIAGMSGGTWADADRILHVLDVDGDGASDLLLQGRTPGTSTLLLRADGEGGFEAPVDLSTVPGMTAALWAAEDRALHAGDLDGDGHDDVLLVQRGMTGSTLLLRADGEGGLSEPEDLTTEHGMAGASWAADHHRVHLGDFDGNGALDVLLQNETPAYASRIVPIGSGGLHRDVHDETGLQEATWAATDHVLHVGDFDGDGRDNILLQARALAEEPHLVLTDTFGRLEAETLLGRFGMAIADWPADRRDLHVGDFNGDGAADILLQGGDDGRSTLLLLSDGAGSFEDGRDITRDQVMGRPLWSAEERQGHVGDFDGDGRDDLLLQGRTTEADTYVLYLD